MEPHANAKFHPLTATTTASRQMQPFAGDPSLTDRVGHLDFVLQGHLVAAEEVIA
jgi:hypothetical protein